MNIYLLLVFVPIVWGGLGLCRGQMLVAKRREVKPPHLRRFAIGLIVAPIAVILIFGGALLYGRNTGWLRTNEGFPIVSCAMFSLPIILAVILLRAKKHATVTQVDGEKQIDFPDVDSSDSKPDFSNLHD